MGSSLLEFPWVLWLVLVWCQVVHWPVVALIHRPRALLRPGPQLEHRWAAGHLPQGEAHSQGHIRHLRVSVARWVPPLVQRQRAVYKQVAVQQAQL